MLTWEAPLKGDWRGLHDHFPRAMTPEGQLLLRQGMVEGEATWFASYGMPARTLQPVFVHGRAFVGPLPLVGKPTNGLPPAFLLRLAIKVVPAFRRRAAAARRALTERPWLAETHQWYTVDRATWVAKNTAFEADDIAALDDDAFVAHLRAVRDSAHQGYREHFRLHGPDLIPTGLLLSRVAAWGIDPAEVAPLLAGSSPASTGADAPPAWRLVSGYDIDERAVCELPALTTKVRSATAVPAEREAALRARVPDSDRDEWDRLLADARATYGLRDDNGLLTAAWPVGLLRRAMLEAGRRAVTRCALESANHAVELTVDEMVTLLAGNGPSAADVAARATTRQELSQSSAPAALGSAPELPIDVLPAAMRTLIGALLAIRELGITQVGTRESLHGTGIGTEVVRGRACVATEPAVAFARFEPGDILVTAGTCPAWNTVLSVAGGVVTEEGGPLSHAAVIAREIGLTGLIGAADALARIPDGAEIEIDPVAGVVRVLPG